VKALVWTACILLLRWLTIVVALTARIKSLAVFPSDEEIGVVAGQAWDEAVALLSLIGVESDDISNPGLDPKGSGDPVPSIGKESDNSKCNHQDGSDHGVEDSYEEESGTVQLQQLIGVQETKDWRTIDGLLQEKMHILTCVAMALDINDIEKL